MRALELEGVVFLGAARVLFHSRAVHPDDLERLVAQVVLLFGVERQDLEGDIGLGNHDRRDQFGFGFFGGGAAMIPIGSVVDSSGTHRDNRLGEAVEFFHHLDHPLEVRGREIALIGRGLHHRDRQQREQMPMIAERLLVGGQRRSAVSLDRGGQFVDLARRLGALWRNGEIRHAREL